MATKSTKHPRRAPSPPPPPPARKRGRIAAVVVAAVAVLGGVAALAFTGGGAGSQATTVAAGYSADKTAFDLPALEGGGHVRLADHAGKPVVVNFFASWCIYCNEELPGFVNVSKATKGQVDFIGVNTAETGDGVAMTKRFDLAGAGFALAKDVGTPPASGLFESLGGRGLPVTAFYSPQGKLLGMSGGMLTQAQLEQALREHYGIAVTAPDAANQASPVIPVNPGGAAELLNTKGNDPSFVVLDVRTPREFAAGHLPLATNLDVTAPDFATRLDGLDKSKTYLVYCHTGNRSGQATAAMHAAGFEHVYDVEGGIAAWEQAGLPTQK